MPKQLDVLFIHPGNHKAIYQSLGKDIAAIEPPIWAGLLAKAALSKGYSAKIFDQTAHAMDAKTIASEAQNLNPKLVVITAYGHQPSASTQSMTEVYSIISEIKGISNLPILLLGGHPSALPEQTLLESKVDFLCQGEGPATLFGLLNVANLKDESQLKKIPGLWRMVDGEIISNPQASLIPSENLSHELPGMAWELLPMGQYRAHNWHCFDDIKNRKPYASLYTSLGCPFKCSFCCINAPFGGPQTTGIRFWNPIHIANELELLHTKYGVKNIKIADEMFVLNPMHVNSLCDEIIKRRLDLNIWAYARVDTVQEKTLLKMKQAGINWLALGIESGSSHVRSGVEKGRFGESEIFQVVKQIQDSGIKVLGNYIFGLPDDDFQSMWDTLNMALKLNCEFSNFYSAMAYPGSNLYTEALEKNWKLPDKWSDYSQHSINTRALPTNHLTAEEVLAFRDFAWDTYFNSQNYLGLVENKFGSTALHHLRDVNQIKLVRNHSTGLSNKITSRAPL